MSEPPDGPQEPPEEPEQPAPAADQRPRTPATQQIGRVVVLVLLVSFVVFALSNSQPVDFSWIVGETQVTEDAAGETTGGVPLIVLLLAAFVIGALSGAVFVRMLKRRRARAAAEREG